MNLRDMIEAVESLRELEMACPVCRRSMKYALVSGLSGGYTVCTGCAMPLVFEGDGVRVLATDEVDALDPDAKIGLMTLQVGVLRHVTKGVVV